MTYTRCLRYLAGLIALACLTTLTALAESSAPSRVTQAIDETKLVTLTGHVIPLATAKNDRGAVADSFSIDHMHLVLQRSAEQEQELNELMEQQNDRSSANFHHWLTAAEFGERFGLSDEDISSVTGWLQSHGFTVNKVYANKVLIDFSGTAGQLREAFHTSIHQIEIKGEAHIANMNNPQIPAALAPVVKGIASLNDIKPKAMHEQVSQYTFAGCSDASPNLTEPGTCYGVTPQDNQTIYSLNPLYKAGISGQGQTIYLVEDTDTYGTAGSNGASDWNTYRSTFGLSTAFPAGTYSMTHPGGCTDPGTNGDDGEAAIDVEVASAIAPSAAIQLVSCPSTTFTFGGQIALQNLVNSASPTLGVVSVSYGLCEAITGAGGNASFYNTYQQAAAEGFSVFVSAGDEGPSSCSNLFGTTGEEFDVASLGVTGWGETPFNVSVGGTDFEDTYMAKKEGVPQSNYWSATNTSGFGSALSYIPEIPWNDACASVLISDVLTGSFTPYGASPATCNNATFSPATTTAATYLSTGAGSGGASNCATGAGGSTQTSDADTAPTCQGYPKPTWQAGTSLPGGVAVYGVPADGVRDIPDVAMFAANGVWGHYEVVCWSDPAFTADGSTSCAGAPSTWAGFGGTSVASPTMAAVQALVNQQTGTTWGNPNPMYYQIAQSEYGTAGGSFLGAACNSSTGSGPGCAFNDVTQGDIDLACEDNGTLEEAHCYKPAGTNGVDSTDKVTAATVITGGSGYTSAPTCTIAGPTNNQPYLAPTGATLYAGGTQATCTAAVSTSTTTAKWTIAIGSATVAGQQITVGPNTFTLAGTSTTAIATALASAINSGSSVATATSTTKTVTVTAKTAGFAGNFNVSWTTGFLEGAADVTITNSTPGQGPNYVSGITITGAGSGYQPDTPITLTGVGSGAVAVANTSTGTASASYQPTYGAAPGYDLATGLGSPNANALVNASAWYKPQSVSFSTNAPQNAVYGSQFTVAASATSGMTVTYTSSGSCTNSGATYTMTSGTGTCSVIASQAGGNDYSAASDTETVNATPATLTVTANNASMTAGSALPAFTATITGFVNNDPSTVVSGAPSLTTTATSSSPAGTYPITASLGTLSAANYTFAFVNGTLSITTAAPTVILTTTATLSGSAASGYTATVTVTNSGTGPASAVILTTAALGGVGATSGVPQSLGAIPAGGSVMTSVGFSGAGTTDGARSSASFAGTYAGGGTFSGSMRVVLP